MTKRPQFCRCYERGRRFFSKNFVLFVRARDAGRSWRLGLAVSKKIGNAVCRNRIKRLVREMFRLAQQELTLAVDIVVVPKRGIQVENLTLGHLQSELGPLMTRIASSGPRPPEH